MKETGRRETKRRKVEYGQGRRVQKERKGKKSEECGGGAGRREIYVKHGGISPREGHTGSVLPKQQPAPHFLSGHNTV